MKTPWFRRGLCATVFGLVLGLAGCFDSDDADPATPQPTPTGTVSGTVVESRTGAGLAGVAVTSSGRSASTSADGNYTLTEVPAGDGKVVSFELAGHAKSVFSVSVPASGAARASARLTPVGATQTFDAATAATVTVAGSAAQVTLPAAGLVTAAGTAATGVVKAELTVIDPASDPRNMPGNFTAQAAGGGTQPIESFGAIKVSLTNAAGATLNLAAGKSATIRIPLSTRSPSPPASVPLFYLNEATGLWLQEGSATLAGSAPNQYYEGTVTHFTYWNADQVTDTITVSGCVEDAIAARVVGAEVSSFGSDYSGSDSTLTNANGQFTVAIRRASIATIVAQLGDRSSNAVRVGPSLVNITLPVCLVLSAGGSAPQIVVQPESQTALPDSYAYFRVEAIGSPTLRYQWQRNGTAIAGATSSTLSVVPVAAADNGSSFTVVVSNPFGSVTSAAAVLTVNTVPQPPLITGQPLPRSVQVGATATFDVVAQSQGGTLSYQWRRNAAAIAGATASSYTTPAAVAGDNGAGFSVVVSSSNGTSVTSNSALLTVSVPTPLAITVQPQNASVGVGQSASFSVTATGGSATRSYQWRRNGSAIAGANAVSYTTPATVLADSGAGFSVVVTSGTESVTSNAATLTVTPPVGASGYYLLASAGPMVEGTITFANGVQTTQTQALLAVNSAAPGNGAVTIEPAGQALPLFFGALEASVSNGQISNLRSRLGAYFKGGRLYRVDQVVTNATVPTPQLMSSLAASAVCGQSGYPSQTFFAEGNDFANPLRSWLFLQGPGADAQCGTPDDNSRAVRFDMAATDTALTIGEPQAEILGADGGFTGLVVRSGNQMQRLDANLGNATDLFSIANVGYSNLGVSFGSAAPGIWLFIDDGKLWGVRLSAPATRVELATLAAGEANSPALAADGSSVFIGLSGASSARVLRVTEALVTSTVATLGSPLRQLALTPTRLVALTNATPATLLSLPKAGGATTTLSVFGAGVNVGLMLASGENVYVSTYQFGATGSSVSTLIVGADGSNPVTLANTEIKRGIAPAVQLLSNGFDTTYAVVLADGVTSIGSNAGATLRVVDGATRNTLVTYGSLPASPDGVLSFGTIDPLQYGLSGLWSFFSTSTAAISDLYYFKSDSAGLIQVTNFGAAAPLRTTRAQAQAMQSGSKAATATRRGAGLLGR